jgi:hemerythrin superfamily protein
MTNIIDLLKEDHKKVKNLLNETIKNRDTSKYPQIQKELRIHMEGEENLLYPKTRNQATDLTLEAYEEHDLVKKELREIDNLNINDEHWMPKMKVVKDLVEHHVEEEEEEYFPKSEEILGMDQLNQLGQKYEDWKNDVSK